MHHGMISVAARYCVALHEMCLSKIPTLCSAKYKNPLLNNISSKGLLTPSSPSVYGALTAAMIRWYSSSMIS